MSQPKTQQPAVTVTKTDVYRENYANSVQVRMTVWDFLLVFGQMQQDTPDKLEIKAFEGVYLSPQQAKALLNVLQHNVAQYEQTFGALALEPQFPPAGGPVH